MGSGFGASSYFGLDCELTQRCQGVVYPGIDPRAVADLAVICGVRTGVVAEPALTQPKPSRSKHAAEVKRLADEVADLKAKQSDIKAKLSAAEKARSDAEAALAQSRKDIAAIEASAAAVATAQQAEIAKLRQQWESVGRMTSPSADAEARFTRLEID